MTCQMQSPGCDGRALMHHCYMPCLILTHAEVSRRWAALCMQVRGKCVAAALGQCASKMQHELLRPRPYQKLWFVVPEGGSRRATTLQKWLMQA